MTEHRSVPPFVQFLAEAQRASMKSDDDVAEALDLGRVNIYQAIKAGRLKLPVGKVPALARVLNVPQSDVLAAVLNDWSPELLQLVQNTWGPVAVTANERKLLEAFRHLAKDQDVEPVVLDGKNVIAIITT